MTRLVVLIVVIALATCVGFVIRRRQGRFTAVPRQAAAGAWQGQPGEPQPGERQPGERQASEHRPGKRPGALTAGDLGAPLGERATLVQFSTQYCAYCPGTRRVLSEVAAEASGVAFVEVDAAQRVDLARRLNILSTPTIFIVRPDGSIASRASGPARKADVLASLATVSGSDSDSSGKA